MGMIDHQSLVFINRKVFDLHPDMIFNYHLLKSCRLDLGLSRRKFLVAVPLGISLRQLVNFETGRTVPKLQYLKQICLFLKKDPALFLGYKELPLNQEYP